MVHNIDTLGANMDPAMLGCHIGAGKTWTTEVIRRRIDDRGGGLARADGHVRLIEGLALPRGDRVHAFLFNSNAAWLEIDRLLALFGLSVRTWRTRRRWRRLCGRWRRACPPTSR